ncbi:lysozyme [Ferrovibrio sp.]|uniref:lysozyme n=1 Tax=Ferrovibrio sp. TaxID=1917215 RepID=UPI003D12F677
MGVLVDLVKYAEGFHKRVRHRLPVMAAPYLCPAGYWTIAWGHLCRQDQPLADEAQGEVWLDGDLALARAAVLGLIRPALSAGQLDALTSWTFNLGSGRLRGSTMRALINRGDFEAVPAELRKWVYGGGQRLPGLVARREAEAALWLS